MIFKTFHFRQTKDGGLWPMSELRRRKLTHLIEPRGGKTVVQVFNDEGVLLNDAEARCSRLDNYNKKLGRLIAEGRALKGLSLTDGEAF